VKKLWLMANIISFTILLSNNVVTLKLSVKSEKMAPEPPIWSHRGWDFKEQWKKVHRASTGHQTQFSSKFGAKLSLPCPFVPERLHPITAAAMCPIAINVLEPCAFHPESQCFIPLINKISWLCGQQPGGDEASNEGCNSGPTGHDFLDNSTKWKILEKTGVTV